MNTEKISIYLHLQPTPTMSPEENLGCENLGFWPNILDDISGMISMSFQTLASSYTEKGIPSGIKRNLLPILHLWFRHYHLSRNTNLASILALAPLTENPGRFKPMG